MNLINTFPILAYFTFEHLPKHLQEVSADFCHLALKTAQRGGDNPQETAAALRSLLVAKDAAVRASLPAQSVALLYVNDSARVIAGGKMSWEKLAQLVLCKWDEMTEEELAAVCVEYKTPEMGAFTELVRGHSLNLADGSHVRVTLELEAVKEGGKSDE